MITWIQMLDHHTRDDLLDSLFNIIHCLSHVGLGIRSVLLGHS